ncbi:hypothetical protein ABZV91_30470 [Nocardia sp. NPDC004568]|uniref:hypothetical protein n=1 Tax=Nocardia sp. NPDC004568 TaxID=3154551 RepID=UPI0033B58AFA
MQTEVRQVVQADFDAAMAVLAARSQVILHPTTEFVGGGEGVLYRLLIDGLVESFTQPSELVDDGVHRVLASPEIIEPILEPDQLHRPASLVAGDDVVALA